MPNLAKYKLWQYRDDNNCWDFVRTILHECFNVPNSAVPKFGICPSNKRQMTAAYLVVSRGFIKTTTPLEGAVVCQFSGRALVHVGVILKGKVWHAGRAFGVKVQSIAEFSRHNKTEFFVWHC